MNFGEALHELGCGRRVAREGWNSDGISVGLQAPDENSKMTAPYLFIDTTGIQTDNALATKRLIPWLPSQSDLFANDWVDVG